MTRGAGDASRGAAQVRGLLVDVVMSSAAVLLTELDLESRVAPRRVVREGDAVGLGGGDHLLDVGSDALVDAEAADKLGAALGDRGLDVIAVGGDLASAAEEQRPGAAADLSAGGQAVVGLELLGGSDRPGAEDAVDLEASTELVQTLLGSLDVDTGVPALDQLDEGAEGVGTSAAVGGEALGLLEGLDLGNRVRTEDTIAVGPEAASGQEVLEALDRVLAAVGSDESVVADRAGSKVTSLDLSSSELKLVRTDRSSGARAQTVLTSRSMLAIEPVAGSTAPRARPTMSSPSSRAVSSAASGVGAATAEKAARGTRRVAREVRRIVIVLAVADDVSERR